MKIEGHTMSAAQADAWLEALERGAYEQGQGFLCREDMSGNKTFCCLGVRAAVAGATFRRYDFNDDTVISLPGWDQLNAGEVLDSAWASEQGLTCEMQNLLSRLNDGTTTWFSHSEPLLELAKVLADKVTPKVPGADPGSMGCTFEFHKHTFAEIAKIIREHFVV